MRVRRGQYEESLPVNSVEKTAGTLRYQHSLQAQDVTVGVEKERQA
jgi:hypothetical protein